eukprot:687902-Rhodomonas_salina.4
MEEGEREVEGEGEGMSGVSESERLRRTNWKTDRQTNGGRRCREGQSGTAPTLRKSSPVIASR